jgi:hypothetical protein
MPRALAIDVDLFSRGGLAILGAIEARGFDVLSERPSLSRWTKLRLVARAFAAQQMASIARPWFNWAGRPEGRARERDVQAGETLPLPLEVSRSGMEGPW